MILFRAIIAGIILAQLYPCAHGEEFSSCGISDIDSIRREIKTTPTTEETYLSRRAAFSRWWRLLWHQGYDMSAASSVAEFITFYKPDAPQAPKNLDAGYVLLEQIQANPEKIPEIRGKPGIKGSSTDWPMYLGTDGSNSGYSPDPGPSLGKIAWRFPKHCNWDARPVLQDDRIYLSAPGTDVVGYCLDARTGEIIWRARQHGFDLYNEWGSFWDPVVTKDRVIIRSSFGGMKTVVVDRKTGKTIEKPSAGAEKPADAGKTLMLFTMEPHKICVGNASTGRLLWEYRLPAPPAGQPELAGNKMYAAALDGTVCRVDTETRKADWKIKLSAPLRGGISMQDERLVIGATDGRLFCLHRENGDTLWTWQCPDREERALQFFSTPRESNGRLYIGGASGYLYCLNASSGSLLWKFQVGSWIRSRPLVIDSTVYVATLDSHLVSLTDEGGQARKKGSVKLGEHGFTADLVGDGNRILCAGRDLMLYSVSPDTGKLQWRHGILDGAWIDGEFIASEWAVGLMGSPAVVEGTMYIGGPDGFVNAVDVQTGREKWRYEVGGALSAMPMVAEGKVFIGQIKAPGRFCALDRETGRLIWESDAFGKVWVAPAYRNGMLFFGNLDGDMFGVRVNDGKTVWSYHTAKDTPLENIPKENSYVHGFPPGIYSNPAVDEKNVYVGSWAGYYFAFEQKSGKLLWRTETKGENGGGLPDSAAPMLHKEHLYVQKAGTHIAALHRDTGEIKWEWKAPVGYLQNGTVAARGDRIFGSFVRGVTTLPYHATIVAFSDVESGGKKRWEYDGGGGLTAPVVTDDKVIFGSSADPFVTCLEPETGKVMWRVYTGGEMLENVPALYGDKVFVQGKNGWIHAIE